MSVIEHEETVLINSIKTLHFIDKLSKKILMNDEFLNYPERNELKRKFRQSWFYENGWKWHALVRIALEPIETREYMYQRLMQLLIKHRRKIDSHFEIKLKQTSVKLPNPLADLNRLELTWRKYFEIYKKIMSNLNFESPKITNIGVIKGTINWNQTIRRSNGLISREFVTSSFKKKYVTPENILLVLCVFWLRFESNRLMHMKFVNPLSANNKILLKKISLESSNILKNFPIKEIIHESKKFWKFSYESNNIKKIIIETKMRIKNNYIVNTNYSNLLTWILDFKNLELNRISSIDSQNKIIESIRDIDHVFEAWIYFEFLDFIYSKGLLINSVYETGNSFFTFTYNSRTIDFYYEKQFSPSNGLAWAKNHEPDFTVMEGNRILAVFDAKNYAKKQSVTDTLDKMLSYMNNLDSNFGALIYPNHPENWDDLDESDKKAKISDIVSPRQETVRISKLSWSELPEFLQKKFPIKSEELITDKKKNRTLGQLRMSPTEHRQHREFTDKTLNTIFESIIQRL